MTIPKQPVEYHQISGSSLTYVLQLSTTETVSCMKDQFISVAEPSKFTRLSVNHFSHRGATLLDKDQEPRACALHIHTQAAPQEKNIVCALFNPIKGRLYTHDHRMYVDGSR